jgi:hypothetical protein
MTLAKSSKSIVLSSRLQNHLLHSTVSVQLCLAQGDGYQLFDDSGPMAVADRRGRLAAVVSCPSADWQV